MQILGLHPIEQKPRGRDHHDRSDGGGQTLRLTVSMRRDLTVPSGSGQLQLPSG